MAHVICNVISYMFSRAYVCVSGNSASTSSWSLRHEGRALISFSWHLVDSYFYFLLWLISSILLCQSTKQDSTRSESQHLQSANVFAPSVFSSCICNNSVHLFTNQKCLLMKVNLQDNEIFWKITQIRGFKFKRRKKLDLQAEAVRI